MKDDKKSNRRDQWREIIDEYLKSGITQKGLCEQRGLNLSQLVYYHSQFKTPAASASFIPVKVAVQDKAPIVSEIKLSLPNGFQCSFPSQTDATQIKRLVEVLLSC